VHDQLAPFEQSPTKKRSHQIEAAQDGRTEENPPFKMLDQQLTLRGTVICGGTEEKSSEVVDLSKVIFGD
jgi:hypothetical protein